MSVGSDVVSFGPWGGPGGDPWSSIATNGIAEITIYSGDVINSILFKDANGVTSGTFGGRSPNPNHLGTERKITIYWPSEYLMSISGSNRRIAGNVVIGSLSFITNLTTYGPFGTTNSDQAFSIPIGDSVVVGFHGRAGYNLDALGIHVQPITIHWPSEDLMSISGLLSSITNLTTYGPFGTTNSDQAFSIPIALRIPVQPINPSGSVSVGPWGGSGGGSFGFKVDPSYIKQIIVYHGQSILSISFKDGDGHEYGTYGGLDPNDKGVKAVVEIDGNSQRLTSISGTYGNYKGHTVITSLSFVINSNINGPYGLQTGTAFSIPIQGSEVVGFHGSSGMYLDSIGLYVKPRASSSATVA